MKNLSLCISAGAVIALGLANQTMASTVLYDSGTATGLQGDGFGLMGLGTGAADFSLGSASTITSFTLTIISETGSAAATTDVDWAIYSRSGTVASSLDASGSVTGLAGINFVSTGNAFDVYDVTVNVGSLNLAAGDYFLATTRANSDNFAFWAFTGAVDGDTSAIGINLLTELGLTGDLTTNNALPGLGFGDLDYAFSITGNSVAVVPLPPAALGGIGLLAGMGAYRRIRK